MNLGALVFAGACVLEWAYGFHGWAIVWALVAIVCAVGGRR